VRLALPLQGVTEAALEMSDYQTAGYYRAEAEQMLEFGEEADDPELAEMYRRLAARFKAKAQSVETEWSVH